MHINFPPIDIGCFSKNYREARQRFLSALSVCGIPSQALAHPLNGPDNTELASDWAWLNSNSADKLLVIISATHGVEGITGSAVQLDLIQPLHQLLKHQTGLQILFIHALNPWGFAWLRRGDEQNIDLNRNFIDFTHVYPDNAGYDAIHTAMLSGNEAELSRYRENVGQVKYEKAVSGGQYRHKDGIYFGGVAPNWSRKMLESQLAEGLPGFKRIAVIDLHTGLGPYGYGEIISDHEPGSDGDAWARRFYGNHVTSPSMGTSSSVAKVGLLDYFWHNILADRGCFITLEFGTYGTDALFECLIQEQILHNRSAQRNESVLCEPAVTRLAEHFNPNDPSWREMVFWRARQVVTMALNGLYEEDK